MPKERIIEWNKTEGWRNWGISDFVAWHRGLVQHFGDEKLSSGYTKADTAFVVFWAGSEGVVYPKMKMMIATPSMFKDEIEYLQKYPTLSTVLQLDTILKLKQVNPINLAATGIKTSVETVENIVGAVGSVGKILKVAIPLALLFSIVLGGMWMYKKFGK